MIGSGHKKRFRTTATFVLAFALLIGIVANQSAQAGAGMLVVFVEHNVVAGFHWTLGSLVTVTIDDPNTPQINPDYTETKSVEVDLGNPTSTKVDFSPGEALTIQPGHFVTLTDGIDTREHTVTNLTGVDGDVCGDTVWGTADPHTEVYVQNYYDRSVQRWVPVNADGNWLADFSVPGPLQGEEETRDMGAYDRFMVLQHENSGHTQYDWIAPNPIIVIHPAVDHAYGSGWPAGSLVTFTVDDPDTPESPDYEETQMVVEDPHDPGRGSPIFLSNTTFDIEIGHHAILTEACFVKEHTVFNLTVQGGDVSSNTIWGTADPNTQVTIVLGQDWSTVRWETVDGDGNWLADFSVSGDEPGEGKVYQFFQDTWLMAFQYDEEHDRTTIDWTPQTAQTVEIDIKPGSDPNSINCTNENGIIPVAIQTTENFDALSVDHATVAFEGASETHVDKKSGEPIRHEKDVDADGDIDLVFHFRFGDTDLTCMSTEGTLVGETFDNTAIAGSDNVRMVGGDD